MNSKKVKPETQTEVAVVGTRIGQIQRRKLAINQRTSALRTEQAKLEEESRDLAQEHQILLRRFDSVAALP